MSFDTIHTLLLLASGLILLVFAYQGWLRRQLPGALAFSALCFFAAYWSLLHALQVNLPADVNTLMLVYRLKIVGMIGVPVTWFLFSAHYTRAIAIRRRHIITLTLMSLAIVLMVWTNDTHNFFATNERIAYRQGIPYLSMTVGAGYSMMLFCFYLLTGLGIFYLLRMAYRMRERDPRLILWVSLSAILAVIAHVISQYRLDFAPPYDYVPLALVITAWILGHRLLKIEMLSLLPLNFEWVIGLLPYGVMITDQHDRILFVNREVTTFLGVSPRDLVGQPLLETVPEARAYLTDVPIHERVRSEAKLHNRIIDVMVNPLMTDPRHVFGRIFIFRDVTAHRQAEAALFANERRYRALFNNSTDAILIMDLDGVILTANERAVKLLQQDMETLVERNISDYIQPDERVDHDRRVVCVLAGDQVPLYERTFINAEGQAVPAEISLTLVTDMNDQPLHMQMIIRDISQRKAAQLALSRERNLLRTLVDSMPDSIFVKDTDGRYTLVNPSFVKLFGMDDMNDILGKTDVEIGYEADLSIFEEEDRQVLEEGQHIHIERFDPVEVSPIDWVATTKVPLRDSNGNVIGLVSVNRDITGWKRSEEELRKRVEQLSVLREVDNEVSSTLSMDDVLQVAIDAAVGLSGANAGFIAALGDDEHVRVIHAIGDYPQDIIGHAIQYDIGIVGRVLLYHEPELVTDVMEDPDYFPDIPDTAAMMVIPLITQTHLIGLMCLETNKKDRFDEDTFEFIQLLGTRITIALDNARLYAYANARLQEVQRLYEQVRQLEQTKTDMIRIASHDLKNPVSVLSGYLSMLEEDKHMFSQLHQEFFVMMEQSVVRMRMMLDDILSLELIEQRAKKLHLQQFSLLPLVRRVLDEFTVNLKNHQHELVIDLPESSEEVAIIGDETQVYEAVANLVSNAIKYTPNGGKIIVSLKRAQDNVQFKVTDNGYGIPDDRHHKLFQPFYRAKTTGTEDIDGTGLGLHLVKNIIERHQGTIIFASTEGEGSTFGFCVPYHRDYNPIPLPEHATDFETS